MNISPITIYLWQLVDQLRITSIPLSSISIILVIISMLVWCNYSTEAAKEENRRPDRIDAADLASYKQLHLFWKGVCKIAAALAILTCGSYVLVPSANTVAMMVIIPEIAQSKVIQKDLPDIYNAAVEALKGDLKK